MFSFLLIFSEHLYVYVIGVWYVETVIQGQSYKKKVFQSSCSNMAWRL